MTMFHPRNAFGVFFTAMVCAAFNISFAAIIYSGELAPYLNRGVGLALLGGIVLGVMGAFVLSNRASIVQAQDAPAILLSGGVATIVSQGQLSGETLFATVAALVFVTSLASGLSLLAVGHCKIALLARYIPYPVLAGFLAATGVLLCKGGIELAIGNELSLGTYSVFFTPLALSKWLPVCGAAICILFVTRMFPKRMTLPIALIATAIGFLGMIRALELSTEDARTQGFLFGPFPEGPLLKGVGPDLLLMADWGAIFSQVPVIFTIVAICLIGMTLNASGLELELGEDVDLNHEARGVGLTNSISAFVGGLPGYHFVGQTLLANKLGLAGPIAGISAALGSVAVLLFGANTLSLIPIGLFATVITFLGLDLILTWFWAKRQKLRIYDYAIVALIPMTALVFSFITAIGVGLLVAFCLFIIAYARLSTTRLHSNVAVRRSFVERSHDQAEILSHIGQRAHFIELTGYLFFGSANALRDKVVVLLNNEDASLKWLIIDIKHVTGMDVSTIQMLLRLQSDCVQRDVRFVLSGINDSSSTTLQPLLDSPETVQFTSLDEALEYVEDWLLVDYLGTSSGQYGDTDGQINGFLTMSDIERHGPKLTLQPGETLIVSGTKSTEIYFLISGQLLVSVPRLGGISKTISKIRPGAMVGEMSYYMQGERSADVIAETVVEVVCIDVQNLEAYSDEGFEFAAAFHKTMARHLSARLKHATTLLRNLES